ncbi:MAG: hypothetical protein AAFN92_01945 [Bacteroidota bacterium]
MLKKYLVWLPFLAALLLSLCLDAQTCTYSKTGNNPPVYSGTCTVAAGMTSLEFDVSNQVVDASMFTDLSGVSIDLGSNNDITFGSSVTVDPSTSFSITGNSGVAIVRFPDGSTFTFNQNGTAPAESSIDDLNMGIANCTMDCDLGAVATSLPITLLQFSVRETAGKVIASWATAAEIGNDFYTLLRSADAEYWTEVGRIDGAGTRQERLDYGTVDPSPMPGTSYYRLQQTDFDGSTTFSEIVTLSRGDSDKLRFYPNPATTAVHLDGVTTAVIRDLSGTIVLRASLDATEPGRLTLDVGELPRGSYLVEAGGKTEFLLVR